MPSWSTVGVRVAARAPWAAPLRHALREDARHLGADLVQAHAQALEDAGGDALALAHQAEQQVLRADVVVAQAAGLVDCQLDNFLGARREADFAHHRAVAAADDEFDGRAYLVQLNTEVGQHLRRYALALADQAQQQVLRANVVVVEAQRFFLGQRQNAARPLGEFVESISHDPTRLLLYSTLS